MPTSLTRARDDIVISIFTAIFLAALVSLIPNYELKAYKNTPVVSYDQYKNQAGYPVGKGFQHIKSTNDIQNLNNFAITLDASKLKATHLYYDLIEGGYSWKEKFFIFKNEDYGQGQYYTAELESGEKIIILLDDSVLQLPKEGSITLPVGKKIQISKDTYFETLQKNENLKDENADWYVDMAGEWRKSKQADDANSRKVLLGIVTAISSFIILRLLFKYLNS